MKKPTRKSAKAKAVKYFNKFIVLRDGKRCVQCGSTENVGCGHVIAKGQGEALLFDEDDCHAQCWAHNYKHSHFPEDYTGWFLEAYGTDLYREIVRRKKEIKKYTIDDFLEIADKYKAKCEALEAR